MPLRFPIASEQNFLTALASARVVNLACRAASAGLDHCAIRGIVAALIPCGGRVMQLRNLLLLAGTTWLALTGVATAGGPRWSVGVGIGFPGYYRPYPYYVPPPMIYYAPPPPVIYAAPPTVVVPAAPPAPAPSSNYELPPPRPLDEAQLMSYQAHVNQLTSPDERVRLDAVSQLGRSKSAKAVDPLAATLAGDPSAAVREAAAKGLGLIGSPTAMPALRRAAQQDGSDHVRRTAQFSIEIIQAR